MIPNAEYEQYGISQIVRLSSNHVEMTSGYQNEYTTEKIACFQAGKYYIVEASYQVKFGPNAGSSMGIISQEEITEQDYHSYGSNRGTID